MKISILTATALAAFFCLILLPTQRDQAFVNQAGLFDAAAAEGSGAVLNVRDYGAKGDGVADDTAPIQAAINRAGRGSTILFPRGAYVVANFTVKNRAGLTFLGEGRESVIKQKSGAERFATFDGSSDIVITKLGFDANGIPSYGGVVFYAMNNLRIEENWFWDSAPKPVQGNDRYSFVIGKGSAPSQNLRIVNNMIDDLQLEVNHSKQVVIDRNVVNRAVKTAGIGIFTVGDNAIAEDYQITNNRIVDSLGAGLSVGIDPPSDGQCIFRRIIIADNQVVRTKTAGYGVRVGTPNNSKKTAGNIFEAIQIKNNRLRIEAGAPPAAQMIFANASDTSGITFTGLTVVGNILENNAPRGKDFAVDLRRVQNSVVAENRIKGFTNGIALSSALSNEIRNNEVDADGVAYALEESLGGNRAVKNRVIGQPRLAWKLTPVRETDSVEK